MARCEDWLRAGKNEKKVLSSFLFKLRTRNSVIGMVDPSVALVLELNCVGPWVGSLGNSLKLNLR